MDVGVAVDLRRVTLALEVLEEGERLLQVVRQPARGHDRAGDGVRRLPEQLVEVAVGPPVAGGDLPLVRPELVHEQVDLAAGLAAGRQDLLQRVGIVLLRDLAPLIAQEMERAREVQPGQADLLRRAGQRRVEVPGVALAVDVIRKIVAAVERQVVDEPAVIGRRVEDVVPGEVDLVTHRSTPCSGVAGFARAAGSGDRPAPHACQTPIEATSRAAGSASG
jgi:hypothetical protein